MNPRPTRLFSVLCASTLFLAVFATQAWGPEGHAIVADIAQQHLTPAASAEVTTLLKQEGLSRLDEISSWADANRKQFPRTGSWHYVDIPLHAGDYVAARDCFQGNCVVARLDHYANVLADRSAAPQVRLEALKWVVHLAGDIHQPLHAEDNDDKGGNTVQVQFFGSGTNLHSLWDGRIIRKALDLQLGPNYTFDHAIVQADAMLLDSTITDAQRTAWAPSTSLSSLGQDAIGWADESHLLAQTVAYTDLAKPSGEAWSQRYQAKAWPVVKTRLEQAGVRLAAILNHALAD
ncbi:MAG: S1/P1 nuclease [Pseudomonadota bacterium]|nr:S1/P1 nuclease [Pseudomonadota bacterium]